MRDWVVAADDRTGAFEIAALIAEVAGPTRVVVDQPVDDPCVVDIGTRGLTAAEATTRAAAVEATPSRWSAHKIDSTLRGQWVPELQARHGVRSRRVVVLPAWPEHGRTCIGGVVHVHGVPLGDVRQLLPGTDRVPDATALRDWLSGDGALAVCDIGDDAAMYATAEVLAHTDVDVLVAGPAGPLGAVFAARTPTRHAGAVPDVEHPVLLVCGSANAVSQAQVALVASTARSGVTVLVAPPAAGQLDWRVADDLAAHARDVARDLEPATIVLVGGDTSAAFLGDAPRLVLGNVAPGMPGSVDADGGGPLVVTKAGGFGSPDALLGLVSRRGG